MPLPEALEHALLERGHLRVAHRGAPSFGMDNTDRCIAASLEYQPDLIEVDAHYTSDGAIILWHDDALEFGGRTLHIARSSLAELRAVRFEDGSTLLTLEEAMDLVSDRAGLMVDLKAPRLETGILEAQRRTNFKTLTVCGGYWNTLRAIKSSNPNIGISFTPGPLETIFGGRLVRAPFWDALTVNWRAVTPAFLEQSHRRNVRVIAWTVDEPERMRTLLEMGVDGITTNRIETLSMLELQRRTT
jgi:glycerophosphoryl diester phosphodiesterase